jgi:predicted dehydrogenase
MKSSSLKVCIIGAGLQFNRRYPSIIESGDKIVGLSSKNVEQGFIHANNLGCIFNENWKTALQESNCNTVLIATPPNTHFEIADYCLDNDINIFIEKPITQKLNEAEKLVSKSMALGVPLWTGFSYRFHPAVIEVLNRIKRNELGKVFFCRISHGIGGRETYLNEWRADPKFAAGGHFFEMGSHLVDLALATIGDIKSVSGKIINLLFQDEPLDDGGFATLTSVNGSVATIDCTLMQWRNLFRFEVVCENGYYEIHGLGGSYDTEKLIIGSRSNSGPFRYEVLEFRNDNTSWNNEWKEFKKNIVSRSNLEKLNGQDGLNVFRIMDKIYLSNQNQKVEFL